LTHYGPFTSHLPAMDDLDLFFSTSEVANWG
jgi:hypothetical protein